ncbi:MAG: heparinase II/III family protein [Hyphomicrobiaceae bacterium]
MLRPRMIATKPVLDRVQAAIAADPLAEQEFHDLLDRTDTIFGMKLLTYDKPGSMARVIANAIEFPPPAPPLPQNFPIAPAPPMLEALFPHLLGRDDATPLRFLPQVSAFEPFAGDEENDAPSMMPEAMGLIQKGYDAFDLAKAGLSRMQALGAAWLLTGDDRYAERGAKEMLAMCALKHWGESHHLAIATFMQALAIGYDWLHAALSDADKVTIRQALFDKGAGPILAAYDPAKNEPWVVRPSNWNIVCNASVLMTELAFGPDASDPRLATLKAAALKSIRNGLQLFADDGSWRLEGPGYWHLACEHTVYLLAALETAGDIETLAAVEVPGIAETGRWRCYMSGPSTRLFNFGDSEEMRPGLWWLRWLGNRYAQSVLHEMAEDRSGKLGAADEVHPMDVLWRRPPMQAPSPPAVVSLPTVQVFKEAAVIRGVWGDPMAAYVGLKGGETSGLRSHSHLDLGHFVYEIAGLRWAIDLEPDSYNACYLEPPERYKYYRTSSFGHNTLVIDGVNQAYRAVGEAGPAVAAQFSAPVISAQSSAVTLDMSAAYPMARSVKRTVSLETSGDLTLVDEISSAAPLREVVWSMHTRATVECEGRHARLGMSYDKQHGSAREMVTLHAWMQGFEGARFESATAGHAVRHEACKKPEKSNSEFKRLFVKMTPSTSDIRLLVRFSLQPKP